MSARRVYARVLREHRRRAAVVFVAAVVAGILEALGLAALLPILGRDDLSNSELYGGFALLGMLLVLSVASRVLADSQLARLTVAVESRLRSQFLHELVTTQWSSVRETRSGDLVTALISESAQVANGANAFLSACTAFVIAACLGVTAFVVNPLLSLVAMVFGLVSFAAYRRAGRAHRANQVDFANAAATVHDEAIGLLGNLKMLFSTGDLGRWSVRIQRRLDEVMALRERDLVLPVATRGSVEAVGALFLVLAMTITVLAGGQPSSAIVTLALFYRVVPRLQSAQSALLVARTQTTWYERWQERSREWRNANPEHDSHVAFEPPLESIELDDVSVSYPGRPEPALEGVTLELRRGRVLAVIGATGSGKSTLIDVLTGLVSTSRGVCRVDGVPLGDIDRGTWQRRIGFVPQEPPVIAGTLLDNVVWLEDEIDRERAAAMVVSAALDDFVATLPYGIDETVGPRGASLSGGQRQRLAVARALYRRPALLVLDEATSGLDPATEQRLLGGVFAAARDSCVLFVTHRLETVRLADDVLVLSGGRVLYMGPVAGLDPTAIATISALQPLEPSAGSA